STDARTDGIGMPINESIVGILVAFEISPQQNTSNEQKHGADDNGNCSDWMPPRPIADPLLKRRPFLLLVTFALFLFIAGVLLFIFCAALVLFLVGFLLILLPLAQLLHFGAETFLLVVEHLHEDVLVSL